MSAAKLSVEKAAFSNIFVGIRAAIQMLNEEVNTWQGWHQATKHGYREICRKRAQMEMNERLLRQLENLAVVKKDRKRAGAGGLKSRNMLVMCPDCGYKARVTRMWIDVGVPKCPNPDCENFDKKMAADESFAAEHAETVGEEVRAHEEMHGVKEYQGDDPFADLPGAGDMDDLDAAIRANKERRK